jgi:NAD(P)H-flavin reductase
MRYLARQKHRNEETQWVRLVYGARQADMLIYTDELKQWQENPAVRVAVTVDRKTPEWNGNVGTVTTLLRRKEMPVNGLYFLAGPEVMMFAVVRLLKEAQVPSQNIYLSMERNMKCAAGHCGRCQYGPYFICKDGPVFSYDKVEFLFGKEGF